MRLDELFDPISVLSEGKRLSAQEMIDLVKRAAPEAFELWLYGERVKGVAKPGTPWTFVVVIPDAEQVSVERGAEILRQLRSIEVPEVRVEFIMARDSQRHNDTSPLYWASHGEGKKVWSDRSRKNA